MAVSQAFVQLPTKPHALYRFFDRTDVLLYVGITMDLPSRVGRHRKGKPWWVAVHHITVEHFDTREDAFAAETEAIATEGPLYNVVHNQLVQAPATQEAQPADQGLAERLARYVLSSMEPGERMDAFNRTSEGEDAEDLSASEFEVASAELVVLDLHLERRRTHEAIQAILDLLPGEERELHRQHALERVKGWGYVSEPALLVAILEEYVSAIARDYLGALPKEEAEEWLACARVADEAGGHLERWAATYARRFKAGMWIESQRMCKATGQYGAGCPTLADHRVWFVMCPFCEWPHCNGHLVWCRRHMHEARDGVLKLPDSELPYPIARFVEVDPSELGPGF